MNLRRKISQALRGGVSPRVLLWEALRRGRVALQQRRERTALDALNHAPARLRPEFARLSPAELLAHFRQRRTPALWADADELAHIAQLQRALFPQETEQLLARAHRIVTEHRWPLLGYGALSFGVEIDWQREPVSGACWPLDYCHNLNLVRGDGADVRILWELNRFGHALTLARAYAVTRDETLAEEFFAHIAGWRAQNPYGRGPNWGCAMEAALRAINLLAAFDILRHSPALTEARLLELLQLFNQHGTFIRGNLEFSYISTSNHYLSDVVGLLWLGVMLPELQDATDWRQFGTRETQREAAKQVWPDGADYEAATGYHRLVTELLLYTHWLRTKNDALPDASEGVRLGAMLGYIRAYLRPDGRAPLIGDTDGAQVLPLTMREANDHSYLLALGAVILRDPACKCVPLPEEVLWLTGAEGVALYQNMADAPAPLSQAFPEAGAYLMRAADLYLNFNASDCGLYGRGSHGHNDALSVEVAACGVPFIVDSGSYVYGADLAARHLFRSTVSHATAQVDGAEQNTTYPQTPFVIGNEARPRVLRWETGPERDFVLAEHHGYTRLAQPVVHRRAVIFDKVKRYWLLEDAFTGTGRHEFCFRFPAGPGLEVSRLEDGTAKIAAATGAYLLICPLWEEMSAPSLTDGWYAYNYGARTRTITLLWQLQAPTPLIARWALLPCRPTAEDEARVKVLRQEIGAEKG